MKKAVFVMAVAATLGGFAQQMSLTDARAQIDKAIGNQAVMTSTVKQLSADDQVQYLAAVNEAISKMPSQPEEKVAKFVDADRAALKGAQKGNVASVLAEVFATASLEALTVLNETLASDVFNRAGDPKVTYTDEQFVALATNTLQKIAARNAEVDDGAVRTGFAILMFVRASNGTPADLANILVDALPVDSREVAKKEWFPAALASGEDKSYDPMLGATDAGQLPNPRVVLRLAAVTAHDALLADLAAGNVTVNGNAQTGFVFNEQYGAADHGGIGAGLDNGLYRAPFERDERRRPIVPIKPEPGPYQGQYFGRR